MDTIKMNQQQKAEFLKDIMKWHPKKLAIESKKRIDEYYETGEGRLFTEGYLLGQIFLLKIGESNFFKEYNKFLGDFDKLIQIAAPSMLMNYFFHGKVFSLTKPVYDLLKNTSNKLFLRKHPFFCFALDQKVETKYEGLSLIFMIFFDVTLKETKESIGCNYIALGIDERDNSEFYVTGDIDCKKSTHTKFFKQEEEEELHKKILEMYANFLDYLNHPYSKQIIFKAPDNTWQRIKRGKFPRQDRIVIDIKHEFIYNKNDGTQSKSKYSHSFWVRGHFKHFRNKIRYKKIYSLNEEELKERKLFYNGVYISRWVLPYIKGIGKIKEKIRRAT